MCPPSVILLHWHDEIPGLASETDTPICLFYLYMVKQCKLSWKIYNTMMYIISVSWYKIKAKEDLLSLSPSPFDPSMCKKPFNVVASQDNWNYFIYCCVV